MSITDHDPTIPDDLAAALHRAANRVPDTDLDPSTPAQRLRTRRRRRRTIAASSVAAALLAGTIVVDRALVDDGGDVQIDEPAQGRPADGAPPAGIGIPLDPGMLDEPLVLFNLWTTLQPDGTTAPLPFAQPGDSPSDVVHLADGRIATLASRDLMPGVEREDGPMVEGVASVLAVFDAEGRLVGEQDIRVVGRDVRLAGEHDGRLILLRTTPPPGGGLGEVTSEVDVTAIDPTTFAETPIATVVLPLFNGYVDLVGDHLIAAGESDPYGTIRRTCAVTAVDLATGGSSDLPAVPCTTGASVAISPDGRYAGVTAYIGNGESGHDTVTATVIDLVESEIVVSEPIATALTTCADDPEHCMAPSPLATVWTGDRELTAVFAPDGAITGQPDEPVIPELLESVTVTVP